MGVIKCCVPNCSSKSSSGIIMHYFPRPPNRRSLWLDQIKCKYLNSLHYNKLISKRVCAKHFERKFYENDRLNSIIARPTLFTAAEISSGIPNRQSDKLYNVCKIPDCLKDHTYYNNLHVLDQQTTLHADSGTLSAGTMCALQQIEKNIPADHNYARKRHWDHSYSKSTVSPLKISQQHENLSDLQSVCDLSLYEEDVQALESEHPDSDTDLQSVCDLSLYEEDVQALESEHPDPDTDTTDVHEGIVCNVCEKQIVGFRYVCVQCADWDHCAACEAGGAHAAHAVLRVHRQAEVQRVIAAVREAILCARAEPESVTLHMDVTHEDGFGQVTMDEDNKDDIQLLELPSPVAEVTERNPLELDAPFYTEDFIENECDTFTQNCYNEVTDNIHEVNILTIECPDAENAREVIHRPQIHPVRVYPNRNNTKLSRVTQDIHHSRTTPIQHAGDVTGGDVIKEHPISIQPFVSTRRDTKELIKQISPKYIKKKTPIAPQESCKSILHQDKENIIEKGKLSQAEVDAAIKRQRLHQDTNSDDSS